MRNLLRSLRDNARHQEFVVVSFACALLVVTTPLQHHMELSRYQHYSFGLFTIAIGFLIQFAWSFRRVNRWGKVTLFGAFVYFSLFGLFFYTNPWLGNADLATEQQLIEQHNTAIALLVVAIPLSVSWIIWNSDMTEAAIAKKKQLKDAHGSDEQRVSE